MKYGDTLRQRSIPEWGHFNIDYDNLKDLIKHHTTPSAGKALSIPGQGNTTERAFGDTFFKVLKAQHDRINLFIKSKSGEIKRRLEHIDKSLAQFQARRPAHVPGSRLPAKTVEKYAKIDADLTKAGEEIQSLSRFRIAQITGVFKILKKYKRWTRDAELEHRFKVEISGNSDSFFQLDLEHLLHQYIAVHGVLRSSFDESDASSISNENTKILSSVRLSKAILEGTEVDFDTALSITPLEPRGNKATYWIHHDHIVEVEVLLLKHMRIYIGPNAKSSTSLNDSPPATPARLQSPATADKYLNNEDHVGLIILDDPESFAKKQNASTVGSSEEATSKFQAKAAGNVRWSSSDEAVVVVGLVSDQDVQVPAQAKKAKLKRKHVEAFLDGSQTVHATPDGLHVQQWLAEHKDVKAVAGICSKRTRFAGQHNGPSGGMWATLDRDVFMKGALHKDLNNDDWFSDAHIDSYRFPYAVLEVRKENNQSTALTQVLDDSHLVERVRGFSLEAHAVWACCNPRSMSPPLWLSLLDTDIRKLPTPVERQRRKAASVADSFSLTSPPQTSTSTTVSGQTSPYASRNGESSATSVPDFEGLPMLHEFRKKSRRPYSEYPLPIQAESHPERQRYWNEYDNPEESGDEGYYIYIDPNAEVKFPGQELVEDCVRMTKKLFGIKNKSKQPQLSSTTDFGSSDDETAYGSRSPRLHGYGTMDFQRSVVSPEGYFSSLFRSLRDSQRDAQKRQQSERERQSLLGEIQAREHDREMTKFQFYATYLACAVVIDIILSIMTATSRRKERGVVDFAILFGTMSNLLLLVVAVLSMWTRHDKLGWMHQGSVLVVGVGIITVDVLLLRWVLNP